jgi:predicted metal-dependent hydrolase
MTINQSIILAKKLINKHKELKYWTVALNKRKSAFGVCNYTKKQIQLSEILIPIMKDEAIKDTIIHEIAHALTKGHNHDKVWKAKCIELGSDGKRCHGIEKYIDGKCQQIVLEKIAKYTLVCPHCGEKYHRYRKPRKIPSCGKHGNYYNKKYELIVIENY